MKLASLKEARALGIAPVVSVSGGKDSTALALALSETALGPNLRFVYAETGWGPPGTSEYLDQLDEKLVGLVGRTIDRVSCGQSLDQLAIKYANWPSSFVRWCTRDLKMKPIKAYHNAIDDGDTISVVGVRAEESSQRAKLPELEDCPRWDGWIWRPIIRWTIEDVLKQHHRHRMPVHPMYKLGFSRVGCFPCILETSPRTGPCFICVLAASAPRPGSER